MPNIDLICAECKKPFYWTERDQAFYTQRGFTRPKRCWDCRQKRKQNSVAGQPQVPTAAAEPRRDDRNKGRRRRDDDYN